MLKIIKLSRKMHLGLLYGVVALGCFIVIANIVASQQMPALFYPFVEGGKEAVVGYLSHIKTLPIFHSELIRYKNEYGAQIQDDVFRADVERRQKIEAIRKELEKQPQSRDLLRSLSLLYREDGNEKLAAAYLEKAKEVDPTVKN